MVARSTQRIRAPVHGFSPPSIRLRARFACGRRTSICGSSATSCRAEERCAACVTRSPKPLLSAGFKFDPDDPAYRKSGKESRYTIYRLSYEPARRGSGPCARQSRSRRQCGRCAAHRSSGRSSRLLARIAGEAAGSRGGAPLEIRPGILGKLALQVSHLVRQAVLVNRARQAFLNGADDSGRPVARHQQRVGASRPAGHARGLKAYGASPERRQVAVPLDPVARCNKAFLPSARIPVAASTASHG
jgi:hypothetical protein